MSSIMDSVQADPRLFGLAIIVLTLLGVLVVLVLLAGLALGRKAGRLEAEARFAASQADQTAAARDDAVKRSRAVLTGQIGEQLAPFFPGFPCDPADVRFVGKPVDYIAFPGLSEGAPGEVVFLEIKTGNARLSPAEAAIRDAVRAGKVSWVDFRLPVGGSSVGGGRVSSADRGGGVGSGSGSSAGGSRSGTGGSQGR